MFDDMTARRHNWLQGVLWFVVLGFLASSLLYGLGTALICYQAPRRGVMTNLDLLADPLLMLLNVGAPTAIAASVFLWFRARHGVGTPRCALALNSLSVLVTVVLAILGIWIYGREMQGRLHLSEDVWWMFAL